MKTRDAKPEKDRDKGEESVAAKPEMARFKALTKRVMAVDKDAVLKEEKKARRKRD